MILNIYKTSRNYERIDKKVKKRQESYFCSIVWVTSKKKQNALSDIDIAIYYDADKKERFQYRMQILGELSEKYDIHTFQDLPIYIKKDIIKEGKIIYKKDLKSTIKIYIECIRKFSYMKKQIDRYCAALRGEAFA